MPNFNHFETDTLAERNQVSVSISCTMEGIWGFDMSTHPIHSSRMAIEVVDYRASYSFI